MKKMTRAYLVCLIFMLIMSVGMCIATHVYRVSYYDAEFSRTFLPTYFVLTPFCVWSYLKYRDKIEGDKSGYAIFMVLFIPVVLTAAFTGIYKFETSLVFFIPLVDAFFVGTCEEPAYRGIVFGNALKEKGLLKGIIISALAFSLLHGINVIGGLSVASVLNQLLHTLVAGVFFALAYYYTKNIILMIMLR